MPKAPPLVRTGFVQGVKPTLDSLVVPPNALWEARNVRADESGVLRIRRGTTAISTSLGAGPVQGGISAFDVVLFGYGRGLYKLASGAYTLITDSEDTVGSAATDEASFIRWAVSGSEIVYMFAGTGIYSTNGTALTLVVPYQPGVGEQVNLIDPSETGTQVVDTGPARCNLSILRAGLSQRIVVAGDPESPNTVYLSAPLDASYWPANQTIQLPDDGSRITGLANWYGAIVIFRDTGVGNDVWAFFGSDATDANAALVVQTPATGCIASRTIVPVPGLGIVFLGADNVYALQGVAAIENQATAVPLGDDVRRLLRTALTTPTGVCAIYWEREYRLCFPATLRQEKVFRLSLQNGANWYPDTGPATTIFIPDGTTLYNGSYTEGRLHKFAEVLYDSGTAIPYYVAFRREALQPGPARIKRLYVYASTKGMTAEEDRAWFGGAFGAEMFHAAITEEVEDITGTVQDLTCTLYIDGAEALEIETKALNIERTDSTDPLFAEPVRIYETRFLPSLKAQFLQLRVTANEGGQDIAVIGYGIDYAVRTATKGRRDGWTA